MALLIVLLLLLMINNVLRLVACCLARPAAGPHNQRGGWGTHAMHDRSITAIDIPSYPCYNAGTDGACPVFVMVSVLGLEHPFCDLQTFVFGNFFRRGEKKHDDFVVFSPIILCRRKRQPHERQRKKNE